MAETKEFVGELDEQINGIRMVVRGLDDSITERAGRLKTLEMRRREIIGSTVLVLLPNLDTATIETLTQKLPGFITVQQVRQQIDETEAVHRSKLADLLPKMNSYESTLAKIQQDLSEARSDLSTLESAFPSLGRDKGMAMLVKQGYGTDRYRPKWYDAISLDFTFFQHWKKADELVAFYNAKDFNQLAEQYTGQVAAASAVQSAEDQLRELRYTKASFDEVNKALSSVPSAVLDRIQSKLKAYLDTLSPVPAWLADLESINSRIASLVAEQRKDQDAHTAANTNLTKLGTLKSKVARSGKREVPDEYVQALRSNRASASSSSSGNVVHIHHSSGGSGFGFFEGVLWGQMDTYFAEQRAYNAGRYDQGRYDNSGFGVGAGRYTHTSSPSWQQADTSGQS